jgi:hypothetical protein
LGDATGQDADGDGCVDTLEGLADLIAGFPEDDLARQMRKPLTSKMEVAGASIAAGDICDAVSALEALAHQIEAQRGKKITDSVAKLLLAYTDNLIVALLVTLSSGIGC